MKYFGADLKEIIANERLMLAMMLLDLMAALALGALGILRLNPDSATVKVGYGDIGGYRDGVWTDMLAYVVMALVLGVLHNLIALKIYHRRGAGMAKFFLITTLAVILGVMVVLLRLTEDG